MERVAAWFECEDGYPTEESIERLSKLDLTPSQAQAFLLADLPIIQQSISCMSVDIRAGDRYGRPVQCIRYITGGWSGAEELISAMLDNLWIKMLHTKWERGGLFEFEVPIRPERLPSNGE